MASVNEGPPIAARGALSDDDRMGAPRCTERTIGMLGDRRLPPAHGDERAILLGWLDWLRATVHRKCDRLSDEAARLRLIPSSELSVASLVSHLRWAEWYWFERCFLGRTSGSDDSTGGWGGGSEPVQDLLSAYEQQCTRSRAIAEQHELDEMEAYAPEGIDLVSLRWILAHVVEETARHLGHIDLLREAADGARGY
jgi:uncharacterized damage-inducible protein DinB